MAHAEIIRLLTCLVVFNHAQLASTKYCVDLLEKSTYSTENACICVDWTSCTARPVGGSERRANVTCTFPENLRQTGKSFAVYQLKITQLVSVYPCNIISGKPVCPEIAGFEPPLSVSNTATFFVPSDTTSSFECNTIPPRETVLTKPCTFPQNDDTESTLATTSNTGTTVDRESDKTTGFHDWQIILCVFVALLVIMGAVALVRFLLHLRNPVLRHHFATQRDKACLEKSELENLNEPGKDAGQELSAFVITEGASGGVAGQDISAVVTTEGASSGVDTLPDWCSCGRCHNMPSECEKMCCGKTPCLSTTKGFETSVLGRVKAWDPEDHELLHGDVNETKRKQAYKLFTVWKHGHSAKGEKYPVYSCCVWAVRNTFPDKNGKYTGFVKGKTISFDMNDWDQKWESQKSS